MRDDLKAQMDERTTEDLVSILRERDEEEWRPEVFAIVAAILSNRGVQGVPQGVGRGGSVNVVEDQPLATVTTYFSPAEAHAARSALESAGIEAWVTDESIGSTYGFAVGARLRVRAEDERASRELLQSFEEAPAALPPELAAPPCPKCGASGATQTSDLALGPDPLGGHVALRRFWYFNCGSCQHRWSDDGN